MKTLADLNTAISAEGVAVSNAVTEATAAFMRLQDRLTLLNLKAGGIVVAGVVSPVVGVTFDLPIAYLPGPGILSALQFDIPMPTGINFLATTPGIAATNAQKSISSAMVGSAVRVIVAGLNTTPIGQGILLTITLKSDPTAIKRIYSMPMAGISGSTGAGNNGILSGVSGSITLT